MKLSEDLRGRTKAFAAKVIRLYVSLPSQKTERLIVEINSEMLKLRKSETGLSLPFRVFASPFFRVSLPLSL